MKWFYDHVGREKDGIQSKGEVVERVRAAQGQEGNNEIRRS